MKIRLLFYTLNRGDKKTEGEKKFSFLKCIPKKKWVLVFSIRIWYLAYPTDRSFKNASATVTKETFFLDEILYFLKEMQQLFLLSSLVAVK